MFLRLPRFTDSGVPGFPIIYVTRVFKTDHYKSKLKSVNVPLQLNYRLN